MMSYKSNQLDTLQCPNIGALQHELLNSFCSSRTNVHACKAREAKMQRQHKHANMVLREQ